MELQSETHPKLTIPWVVTALCDAVLTLRGPQTEGIFRCVCVHVCVRVCGIERECVCVCVCVCVFIVFTLYICTCI